ncbi:NAD(P)-binding domain-containing protein [Massilia agilis]|uniref:NAD(P)-binding domain-containing protein n=1 Tax=Massilia agilis TaxID=1811226 RepID=A0ABT2D9N3_9BURK|nr:NAD(P)-binding domain-containing protein [Massilia agilis]MCS0808012.1 NAD(P)-binding domain-containing protein [Massilia agilis]
MSTATTLNNLPVAVLGAGPVGLAAAAHLLERGLTPLVLEAGSAVAANLATYRQVRLFSPWQFNVDKAARRLLLQHGWNAPADDGLPTAGELVDQYLAPLASLPALAPHLKFGQRVIAITRAGFDKVKTKGREAAPFIVRTQTAEGPQEFLARAVIDATGTWSHPNPLGANGIAAIGESALGERIAYGMPDVAGLERSRYAGQRVLVVGAGHSAAGSLLALAQLAEQDPRTSIVWATRSSQLARVFGGGDADGLRARGQLGQRLKALRDSGALEMHEDFRIREIVESGGKLHVIGELKDGSASAIDGIDRIVCATGARPDLSITRELRVRHDPWLESTDLLAPLIDPNEHSCGSVRPHGHRELAHPESGYYAVGAKSYGRAPNFLMATGYEQVRSVVAALAGDMGAADDVQLELPETGVCNTRLAYDDAETDKSSGCCGGPGPRGEAQDQSSGCCGGPGPRGDAQDQSSGCCGGAKPAAGTGTLRLSELPARWFRTLALSGAHCCA